MVSAFPAIQINTIDASVSPQNNIVAQIGGIGLTCANGVLLQDVNLAPGTSNLPLAFPAGVGAAVFIYISSITVQDLVVSAGTPTAVLPPLPYRQGMLFYGLTVSEIFLSSVMGGQVQYVVGG